MIFLNCCSDPTGLLLQLKFSVYLRVAVGVVIFTARRQENETSIPPVEYFLRFGMTIQKMRDIHEVLGLSMAVSTS